MKKFAAPMVIAACWSTFSTPVFADKSASPDKSALAADLFNQGIELMGQGKFNRACPFLEMSYRREPLLGALLALADCEYERGRLNTALGRYQEYVNRHDNLADSARNKQGNRLQEARTRIAELKRAVPTLKIKVSEKIKVPVVHLDGVRIRPGEAYPVDPGKHEITLDAHGYETQTVKVEARKGVAQEVPLDEGRLLPEKSTPSAGVSRRANPPVDDSNDQVQRTVGVIVGTVVLVGGIIACVFAVTALSEDGTQARTASDSFRTSQSASSFGLTTVVGSKPSSPIQTGLPSVMPMVQVGQSAEQPVIFGIRGHF